MSATTSPPKRAAELLQIAAESRGREVLGPHEIEQLDVEVEAGADPLARRPLAPLEDDDHQRAEAAAERQPSWRAAGAADG